MDIPAFANNRALEMSVNNELSPATPTATCGVSYNLNVPAGWAVALTNETFKGGAELVRPATVTVNGSVDLATGRSTRSTVTSTLNLTQELIPIATFRAPSSQSR